MTVELTRRRFVEGGAAIGAGVALSGPLTALAARSGKGGGKRHRSDGYGPLAPRPEADTGVDWLELPPGFEYRIVSKQGETMDDGNPTPGIFDGMAAYKGPRNTTILIRNHENRSREGEIPVVVPDRKRYDRDPDVRGGNTKLVVGRDRRPKESFAVLGGTHTNCAGGRTPWETWITCEEIFVYGAGASTPPGTRHGYIFEIPANAAGPVNPLEVPDAGRFSHEAVAWLDGVLYETEDRGDACFYRFIPARRPREFGDLATWGGRLEALVVKDHPNLDMDSVEPGEKLALDWVEIEDPDPDSDTVRAEAQSKGAAIFSRTEGIWASNKRVYFDCTSGGAAGLGQLWELTPDDGDRDRGGNGRGPSHGRRRSDELRLIYESTSADDLEAPDNLVVVPATGHVFLQEDGGGDQFVRGVTRDGRIYDFAKSHRNGTEFCGGCFSADGRTFFLNQQGNRQTGDEDPLNPSDESAGATYAIWGPFGDSR